MTDMTNDQRIEFRRQIGVAMIGVQNNHLRHGADVIVPELIAALVSLAAYIARDNGAIEREAFEELCDQTIELEWSRTERDSWLQ